MITFLGTRTNKDLIKTRSSMNNFIGIRIGQRVAAGESYPALFDDGNTWGWYPGDDPATLSLDGSNYVISHNDKLGSGHDKIGGGVNQKPLWTSPGIITFDGINDYTWIIAGHAQPLCFYLVAKQITWTLSERIIDDGTTNFQFSQSNTTSPAVRMLAGGVLGHNNNWPLDTWAIVRVFFNGASSKIQINKTAALTGNAGANAAAAIRDGCALSNWAYKEQVIRIIVDTATNEDIIYNYLADKYGL